MGHRIKEIREALNAIANDRKNFHFAVRPGKTFENISVGRDSIVLFKQQRDAVPKVERDVLGRDNDRREILSLLKTDDNTVIPIVGSGGLGKTTLARLIFDDDKAKDYFDLRMWVSVGDVDFSVDEIAEKAIKSAIDEKKVNGDNIGKKRTEGGGTKKLRKTYDDRTEDFYMGVEEVEEVDKEAEVEVEFDNRDKFRKIICKKRILLVLDDVWSEDRNRWVDLENLWKDDGAKGSKVLLTTRSLIVAKITGNPKPYQLGFLSSEDSCSLFKKIVFGKKEALNQDVEKNVEIIVMKCGGVPLAIKIIANLLYSLNPETEWLPYVTSELSKYPQANKNIFPTLQLSYHHLPSPLKYCFAYCKIFPKGYEISVRMLIQLWIAQGYIRPSDMADQSLEDSGMQFCKVLLARSFFQNEVVDEFGNLISLKMHDIMYELASYVGGTDVVFSNPLGKEVNTNTRHLSYDGLFSRSLGPNLSFFLEVKKLRTFLSVDCDDMSESGGQRIQSHECGEILKKLKSIMVLDLHKSDVKDEVLEHTGKLNHLRYLDLSFTKIKNLPKSITKLQNLQVLNIKNCVQLEELPNDIRKLVSLRFLDCEGCDKLTYMPTGLKYLTSLHTLTKFVVNSAYSLKHGAGLDELNSLEQLKSLVIENLKDVDFQGFKGGKLKEKKHLRFLSLYWYNWQSAPNNDYTDGDRFDNVLQKLEPPPCLEQLLINTYQGVKFPNWFSGLKNLVGIKFEGCKKCQHLPPLSQLFFLKVICISRCSDLLYVEDERSHGGILFPSLKRLVLKNCPKLERWSKSEDNADEYTTPIRSPQFQCLSILSISDCPKLTFMPLFPTLDEELLLERTSIKPLEQTMKTNVPVSTTITSSLVYPLSRLKKLTIWRNAELTSVPEEWMVKLKSLQALDLRYCPYLSETCGNKNGADWHKISRICNITVGNKTIQKEGRYQLNDQ